MGESTGKFWRELRRRRVVSTAAAYAAVAFVLLQLGEILFPAFGFGPDALQALFWVLLAAFPVVATLSWIFDITRQGIRRTEPSVDQGGVPVEVEDVAVVQEARRTRVPPALAFTMGLAMSALVGAVGWQSMHEDPVPPAVYGESGSAIAVLPFVDRSPAQDQGYLGDGVAEEILGALAGVEGLQVAARTSSFAFRSTTENPGPTALEIGQRLSVGWLLEGSVLRDGSRLRVSASLVETSTGRAVWTEAFESDSGDLFAVQDSIAVAIVGELLGRLELVESREARHVAAPEAQDAYSRGRAQWSRRDARAIPAALRLFQEAVQIDSLYASAYAGLADSHALMPQFVRGVSADEAWARAEDFARKALALDPSLAEAHTSLGLVRAMQRDRVGAIRALNEAIQVNSSYAPALHWRANVFADMANLENALRDITRAAELDPLSPAIAADRGSFLLWSGDLEGAEGEFERALELEFGFGPAAFGKAMVALERGERLPFLMQFTQWGVVMGLPGPLAGRIANAISSQRDGVPVELATISSEIEALAGLRTAVMARLHALLGDGATAFEWLAVAVEDGSWVTEYLAVNSAYAPYRDAPEFAVLLGELGG